MRFQCFISTKLYGQVKHVHSPNINMKLYGHVKPVHSPKINMKLNGQVKPVHSPNINMKLYGHVKPVHSPIINMKLYGHVKPVHSPNINMKLYGQVKKFRFQASRYFVCMYHQVDKSTWIKMWSLQWSKPNACQLLDFIEYISWGLAQRLQILLLSKITWNNLLGLYYNSYCTNLIDVNVILTFNLLWLFSKSLIYGELFL